MNWIELLMTNVSDYTYPGTIISSLFQKTLSDSEPLTNWVPVTQSIISQIVLLSWKLQQTQACQLPH